MPLPAQFRTEAEIPEALKGHYVEFKLPDDSVVYRLDVGPVDGVELQHVQGLKSSLERTTTERNNLRDQLKVIPKGVKIEDLPSQLEELNTLRSGRTSRETELQDSLTSRSAELREAQAEVARLEGQGALQMAVASAGGNGRFLVPALAREVKAVRQEDGTFQVNVVGADGQARQKTDAQGQVSPMTVEDLVAERRKDPEYGALFTAQKSGAGAEEKPPGPGAGESAARSLVERMAEGAREMVSMAPGASA